MIDNDDDDFDDNDDDFDDDNDDDCNGDAVAVALHGLPSPFSNLFYQMIMRRRIIIKIFFIFMMTLKLMMLMILMTMMMIAMKMPLPYTGFLLSESGFVPAGEFAILFRSLLLSFIFCVLSLSRYEESLQFFFIFPFIFCVLSYIFVPAGELAILLRYFLPDDHEEENYHQNIGELAIRQKTFCDFPTR